MSTMNTTGSKVTCKSADYQKGRGRQQTRSAPKSAGAVPQNHPTKVRVGLFRSCQLPCHKSNKLATFPLICHNINILATVAMVGNTQAGILGYSHYVGFPGKTAKSFNDYRR